MMQVFIVSCMDVSLPESMSKIVRKFINLNRKYARRLMYRYPNFFGSESYHDKVQEMISLFLRERKPTNILEIGGIDRPFLEKGQGYIYDGLDIEERKDCYKIYDNFFVQSVEDEIAGRYDCVISITLLEHVKDNNACVKNIYSSLNHGGATFHYIPSKLHPYSISLRILGEKLQKRLIPLLRPGAETVSGYVAYFDYCSPDAMSRLFSKHGFTDMEVNVYYRANDYFAFFVPFFVLVTIFENVCKIFDLRMFASGFIISARRDK